MHGTCVFLHVNFCMEAGLQEERTSALRRELRKHTGKTVTTPCRFILGWWRSQDTAAPLYGLWLRWQVQKWQAPGDRQEPTCGEVELQAVCPQPSHDTIHDLLCMTWRHGW